jgi:hypothetical protein
LAFVVLDTVIVWLQVKNNVVVVRGDLTKDDDHIFDVSFDAVLEPVFQFRFGFCHVRDLAGQDHMAALRTLANPSEYVSRLSNLINAFP